MKHIYAILIFGLGLALLPHTVAAATCTRTYDFKINGYDATGTIRTEDDNGYGSFTVFNYPYGTPTTLYNVAVTTEGSNVNNNGKCYTKNEMEESFDWAFDHGVWQFFAQDDSDGWVHNLAGTCGNTHIFTRTVVAESTNRPTGGGSICNEAFHIIERNQNRAAHQTECRARGSGWDLAYVSATNASAINQRISQLTLVGNRVTGTTDYEYPYKCGIETTWPEPLKTLIYDGTCFADIADTVTYGRALCYDSTPICLQDAQCGSTLNECALGTLLDTADTPSQYRWDCQGIAGGNSVSCALNKENANPNGNNGNQSDDVPYCTVSQAASSDRVAYTGSDMLWNIALSANKQVGTQYDWMSSIEQIAEKNSKSFSYTSNTPVSIGSNDVRVSIRQGNTTETVSCPAVEFIEPMTLEIVNPVVDEESECEVRWGNVKTDGQCTLYYAEGVAKEVIRSENSTALVKPTHGYYIGCNFYDKNNPTSLIGSIKTEKVVCLSSGLLKEI